MVQSIIGTTADGNIGLATLTKLNAFNADYFLALFKLSKIERYMDIIKKRPSSSKYLYGWINRALERSA
jgi:hypothetical protein